MKMRFLLILMSALLFVGCKKEEFEVEKESGTKKVPVTLEISLDGDDTRTNFSDILNGKIKWGSKSCDEYVYLSVGTTEKYFSRRYRDTISVGEMFELWAYARLDLPRDKLMFKGEIEEKYLLNLKEECKLFYFSMDGRGQYNNVIESIYDPENGKLIGKKVNYSRQNGDFNMFGYYHIASAPVVVNEVRDGDGNIIEFALSLKNGKFDNLMAIAMLDLKGETSIGGTATKLQSYIVQWDCLNHKLVETYDYSQDGIFDVRNNVGQRSLIAFFPTEERVEIKSTKGVYVFEDGIKSNHFYIGQLGDSLGNTKPLVWEKPKP